MKIQVALVGDYSANVVAHRAIPVALQKAANAARADISWQWVHTTAIDPGAAMLEGFDGVWLVPASPYRNMAGALAAVRFARETKRPFLGTCGGFQHALIEFARNVAGITDAEHGETSPTATTQLVTPLACALVEQSGEIRFTDGSLISAAYGRASAVEGYRCSYGLNETYRLGLERAGLRFTAFDEDGHIRAAELPTSAHPFFVGTLFQPERAALRGEAPPLITAFARAVRESGARS